MLWIKAVRNAFGISQEFVATLLATKRSNINQFEMNRRLFSSDTISRLYALEEVMRNASALPVSAIQTNAETGQKLKRNQVLLKRVKVCNLEAAKLKIRLENMQEKYNVCTLRLKAVDVYRKEYPKQNPDNIADKSDKLAEIWYTMFETQTLLDLEDCGTSAQDLLQLRVSTLEFEVGKALEMMA